jgi:pyrroline-5-carboxylate reductase
MLRRIFERRPTMRYGFIGGGNMARALLGGMLKAGIAVEQIVVSEPFVSTREALARDFSVRVSPSNLNAAQADIWVLAIKPQMLGAVCAELRAESQSKQPLVISILAGITVDAIAQALPGARVIRTMPNTPALIQAGVTALFADASVSSAEKTEAEQLLSVCGRTLWLANEQLMDTVTATSGSGPAYFFLLMESMIAAATKQGMPAELARVLVLETAYGAALMARTSEESVSVLRERVTSPGGTTAAALHSFANAGFGASVEAALEAARARGAELSVQFGA